MAWRLRSLFLLIALISFSGLLLPVFAAHLDHHKIKSEVLIHGKKSSDGSRKMYRKTFDSEEKANAFVKNNCATATSSNSSDCEANQVWGADEVTTTQADLSAVYAGDPLASNQWSLFPQLVNGEIVSGTDIDALRAWTVTRGPTSANAIRIYILDSGAEYREPDLKAAYDAGYNIIAPDTAPTDDNGHGTHVAGIIGASGSNSYGITGVVPGNGANTPKFIVPIKFLNADNQGDTVGVIKALNTAYDDLSRTNPDHCAFNLSFSGKVYSPGFRDAMLKISQRFGCLFVTSAGNAGENNDTSPTYPCNLSSEVPGVVCVAASNRNDEMANFSSYGASTVHLMAPGTGIYSTVPGRMVSNSYQSNYALKDGTSQAVPHVVGASALIWSANPALTAGDVRDVLVSSVDRIPDGDKYVLSGGRLNAYRAVLVASGRDPSAADRYDSGGGGCSLDAQKSRSTMNPFFIVALSLSVSLALVLRRRSNARL